MLTTETKPHETYLHGSLDNKGQILKIKWVKYQKVAEVSRHPRNAHFALLPS